MPLPPSGTVTFLFTDIEGSTRLWEERPDEMRVWVAEHDARFREVIEANDGYVFATGGDGFAAAFGRAARSSSEPSCSHSAELMPSDGRKVVGIISAGASVLAPRQGDASERAGGYPRSPHAWTSRVPTAVEVSMR